MRHRKSGLKLNRNSSNRKALFRNLAIALIEHKLIKTTLPKAKELRRFVEPLVTISKNDSVANRRLAFSRLNNKQAVGQLFTEVAAKSKNRPGGYTRIIKAGYRAGDNAPMAYVEFVDRKLEEPLQFETKTKKTPDAVNTASPEPVVAETTHQESVTSEQATAAATEQAEAVVSNGVPNPSNNSNPAEATPNTTEDKT